MPDIAHKIVICAAREGLVIQPLPSKGQRPPQGVLINYDDAAVSTAGRDQIPDYTRPDLSFEALGVIGLITVSKLSYLITIAQRQQVAQIFGQSIYVVTEVAITPCSAEADAVDAIRKTSLHLRGLVSPHLSSEESDSNAENETGVPPRASDEIDDAAELVDNPHPDSARSSIAEDVMRKRGTYGRFAQRWFSRGGWTQDQKRTMGMSDSVTFQAPGLKGGTKLSEETMPGGVHLTEVPSEVTTMLPKLLRTCQVLFGTSRSFYFSYDLDITRSLQNKVAHPQTDAPLHSQVDPYFFWNRHIINPFITAGQESLALPLMQGFVGQRSFLVDTHPPQLDDGAKDSVELRHLSPTDNLQPMSPGGDSPAGRDLSEKKITEKNYQITLISRRSTKRAGLRYLRRGVDQDGFVANMVETEQLLTPSSWEQSSRFHSFLQIRGSIPAFFMQSPYSIKPVPVLQHSDDTNFAACEQHFERLTRNYGDVQIVNLVEKLGIEAKIGERYEKMVYQINEKTTSEDKTAEADVSSSLAFEWFDFHHACRGMNFENVSMLLLKLKDSLEAFGSTSQENGVSTGKQKGVFRTNCMDCLDRTNVCQSSFGKHMLEVQLKEEGIDMSAQLDQQTSWFNTLWADNGDAVSKQYASTAAMKGDYTRTRKRDYRGALNDFGLSVARFYSGMVNDYFSQAAIDFLLGNVTDQAFDEFESEMMTKDPAVSLARVRQQAIELCQKRVISDDKEEYHGGWALLSPSTPDSIRAWPMEEVVLLLTDVAVYLCRFDWSMDKVSSFERVALVSIIGVKSGTYITSTISPSHMNEAKNVGLVISYQPGKTDVKRTNTRTLSSTGEMDAKSPPETETVLKRPTSIISMFSVGAKGPSQQKLTLKIPYTDSSTVGAGPGPTQTELEQAGAICTDIDRLASDSRPLRKGREWTSIVEKGPIISLEEAKRNTGLLEQWGHSIKKFVWA